MAQTCPICIEDFTAKLRKEVICPYCNYTTCVLCMKQHILNQKNPNCMSCHIEFNREFVDLNMTKTFRTKELPLHRENVLVEREKSLLIETIEHAEKVVRRRNMEKECKEMESRKQEMLRLIDAEIRKKRNDFYAEEATRETDGDASTSQGKKERKTFIKACVVTDCRGFLSSQYKCGICETWVCPHCHEIKQGQKDENHKCNPDMVESVKMIAKETKPCPKCAAAISKVSGCDQMWCVECHTTFSWNSGLEITTANVHNPHYYEWLRRTNNGEVPRNPLDNPCADNRLPHATTIIGNYPASLYITRITNLLRCLSHINDYEVIRNPNNDVVALNRDLRVQYLLKELDEDSWKKQLQKREKKRDFDLAKSQVCEMIIQVGGEFMNQMARSTLDNEKVLEIETNLERIVKYYNESMQKVHDRFISKAKAWKIKEDTWTMW